jgi:hypothetical protein
MKTLVKGTIESIAVDVFDKSGTLDDLSPLSPTYDVKKRAGDNWLMQNSAPTVDGLTVYCLIDTTGVDYTVGFYQLFVKFSNPPETPRVGPLDFEVAHAMPEVAQDDFNGSGPPLSIQHPIVIPDTPSGVDVMNGFSALADDSAPIVMGENIPWLSVPIYDTDGFINGTGDGVVIPDGLDGVYLIEVALFAINGAGLSALQGIIVEPSQTWQFVCGKMTTSSDYIGSVAVVRPLSAGDAVSISMDNQGSATQVTLIGSKTRLSLTRLGPLPA